MHRHARMRAAARTAQLLAFALGAFMASGCGSGAAGDSAASNLIAFQSDRDGTADVYVMHDDGSGIRRLTTSGTRADVGTVREQGALAPRWSPDRNEIAYTHTVRDQSNVVIATSDGETVREFPLHTGWAGWSPDGQELAFACRDDGVWLCLADAAQGRPRPLVNLGSITTSPAWRPGGTVVFASGYRGSEPALLGDHPVLFRVPTRNNEDDYSGVLVGGMPDWSPDGRRLVFAATWARQEGVHENNPEIYVATFDARGMPTGAPKRLTHHAGVDAFPSWSPDGRRIVYSAQSTPKNFDIYVMNADGTGKQRLTSGPSFDVAPDW